MAEKLCNLSKNGSNGIESTTVKDVNNNNITINKIGNVVQIYVSQTYNVTASTNYQIFTIPQGYRPITLCGFAVVISAINGQPALLQIDANGRVTLNGWVHSGTTAVAQSFVYLTTE